MTNDSLAHVVKSRITTKQDFGREEFILREVAASGPNSGEHDIVYKLHPETQSTTAPL